MTSEGEPIKRPKIPSGWGQDYHQFILEPENIERHNTKEPPPCSVCGSQLTIVWEDGDSLEGNRKTTVYFVIKNVPAYTCNTCGDHAIDLQAVDEIENKAGQILIDLGIRKLPQESSSE